MPKTEPTIAMETAMDMVQTAAVKTQTAQPTLTPTPTPTYLPWQVPTNTPLPRQTYIDPEGWYKVTFPIDWKPVDDKPNHFAGNNGDFFETGYLPEMGYVTNALTACLWFANVEAHEKDNSILNGALLESRRSDFCSVYSKHYDPNVRPHITYEVQENPGADPAHRFVYLKQGFINGINGDAYLLRTKPVNNQAKFDPGVVPLSPEESDFWGDPASLPSNISVTEFILPPEAQVSPSEIEFYEFVPEELHREDAQVPTSTPYKKLTTEEQLASLGYELTGRPGELRQLFRDGRILFNNINTDVRGVYNFQTTSGPINAFVVYTAGSTDVYMYGFLVENDSISTWDYNHQDPRFPPILYQDELLWLKTTKNFKHIQVIKSNREVLFSFTAAVEPMYAIHNFSAWNGHWIMDTGNFLIQDGEILNEKFGYPEVFNWGLIKGKPIYFFRKGSRIGISYGDKILPIQYQDVAHGLCCRFSGNNPYITYNSIRFFGKKDGAWHYVVVKFE